MAAALLASGTDIAVLVALANLLVVPGCALSCWFSGADRIARAVVVIAGSLAWTVLATSVLAWLQVVSLGALLVVTAGLSGLSSAIFLGTVLPGSRDRGSPASFARTRTSSARQVLAWNASLTGILGIAGALLLVATAQARRHALSSYGLLPVLGVPFLLAVLITTGVLLIALRQAKTAWPGAAAALLLLIIALNGTPALLAVNPTGSATYKHFGVVSYIFQGGALNDKLDIYQQWPGFFAAAAGLERLAGRSPLAYSNWAQLFFVLLNGFMIYAIARRISRDHHIMPYIAVLLFETACWEGTFYYSPQTLAFTLSLAFQFFLLALLDTREIRPLFARWSWPGVPGLVLDDSESSARLTARLRAPGLVALFAAIVITHQLTPFILIGGALCLYMIGALRRPWLIAALAAVLLGFTVLHLPAVGGNHVLSGFRISNLMGNAGSVTSSVPASRQEVLAGLLAKAIGLTFWAVTAICVLSYRRHIGAVLIPALLAATPLVLGLVSSYGGEAIYRIFLFSSPWCALVIAYRITPLLRSSAVGLALVGAWAVLAGLGSAQAQIFGQFSFVRVSSSDIAASAYFLDHAPVGAEIVTAAARNFPGRLNYRYVLHNPNNRQNDPSLDELSRLRGAGLSKASPEVIAKDVDGLARGAGYLAISPSMEYYVDYYGVYAPGALPALAFRLERSPYWQVWYDRDGTVILRARPGS
jgi:hypothetical protein